MKDVVNPEAVTEVFVGNDRGFAIPVKSVEWGSEKREWEETKVTAEINRELREIHVGGKKTSLCLDNYTEERWSEVLTG